MKALLLGGAGYFGGLILQGLGAGGAIEAVRLGSRSIETAQRAASKASLPASAVMLDIADEAALDREISAVDIVLNAAGDAAETAPKAFRAALRANKAYVDLSAEVGALLEAERAVSVYGAPRAPMVLGSGVHPGLVEMLGAHAANALDAVASVEMTMIVTIEDYGPPEHFLSLFRKGWNGSNGLQTMLKLPGMTAYRTRRGVREDVPPGLPLAPLISPEGRRLKGFALSTIEPLALSRALGPQVDASMTASYWPPAAMTIVREAAPGFLSGDAAFAPVLAAMWSAIAAEARPRPQVHFWAVARGESEGRRAKATAFSRQAWASQAAAAETTTRMFLHTANAVASGRIAQSGVLAPVELFQPEEIFALLAPPDRPEVAVTIEAY